VGRWGGKKTKKNLAVHKREYVGKGEGFGQKRSSSRFATHKHAKGRKIGESKGRGGQARGGGPFSSHLRKDDGVAVFVGPGKRKEKNTRRSDGGGDRVPHKNKHPRATKNPRTTTYSKKKEQWGGIQQPVGVKSRGTGKNQY